VAVPSILTSEAISETFSAIWHGRFGNINYRSFAFATLGGVLGIAFAVLVIGVFLTAVDAKLYIGGIAVVMGGFVVLRSHPWLTKHSRHGDNTSRPLTAALGLVCGFNKSSTGGGYGPLSTSGFQLLGLAPSKAVGTTILTKGVACILSILLWAGLVGIEWTMALLMTAGAFVGAPVASWTNNYLKLRFSPRYHGGLLGMIMAALGVYTVLHVLGAM
jgi:uncharacterized protein